VAADEVIPTLATSESSPPPTMVASAGPVAEELELRQSFNAKLNRSPIRGFDLSHQLGRLRQGRKMQSAEVELIFKTLAQTIQTEDQVIEVSPFPLGLGLFDLP
jgi:hypothetical protein